MWGPDPATAEVPPRHRFGHLDHDLNLEQVEGRVSVFPLCLLPGGDKLQMPGCALLRQNKAKFPSIAVPPTCSPKCGDKVHEVYDLMQSGRKHRIGTPLSVLPPSLVLVPEGVVHFLVAPISAEYRGPPQTKLSLLLEGIFLLPSTFPAWLLVLAGHLRRLSDNWVIKRFGFLGIINQ